MIHWFNFNGEDSRDYGLYITSKTAYDKPERDISVIPVAGRSGDLIVDNGRYRNLEINLGLRLVVDNYGEPDNVAFYRCYDRVAAWLSQSAAYSKYYDSYNPEYFRLASIKSSIKLKQRFKDIADFTLTLTCKPYKYTFDGENIKSVYPLSTGSSFTIENPESEISLPIIRVYTNVEYDASANPPVEHTIGIRSASSGTMKTFTITQISQSCTIDSEMMNVYHGTINKNGNYLNDTFPVLYPGVNTIYAVNNVSRLDITPRWRTI